MENIYRVLIIENNMSGVELADREIKKTFRDYHLGQVGTKEEFVKALVEYRPDIILSSYDLPGFDGLTALKIALEHAPLIPFIIVTESANESTAEECIRAGASDYILKEHIRRLGASMVNAIAQKQINIDKVIAETLLKESEAMYRLMFSDYPHPMWVYEIETHAFLEVNKASINHYGYSRNEFLSMTLKEIVHSDDLASMEHGENDGLLNCYESLEGRHIKKNGEIINVEIVFHPIIYKKRKARHVFIKDITDRRKAEEALRYNEEKYRTIFENIQDIFYETDLNGTLLEVSPSVKHFSDYTREEIVGKPVFDLYLNPNDRDLLVKTILERGELRDFEVKFKMKNGDVKYTSINARLIYDAKGEPVRINGLIRDVTERKQAERKVKLLSKAIEQSPVSVIITDREGVFRYVNPKFTEITGYTFEEVNGKTPRILKSGYHSTDFYKNFWETISTGKEWHGEFQNKRKNGELYWDRSVISSIVNSHGEISFYIGVQEDVTEYKKLTLELISAKEKAEESDRLKTAFLHNISHEIRTPINAIMGFSAFIDDPALSQTKRKQFADIIIKSSNHLLSLITDVVNMATIEAGQEKINNKRFNLNSVMDLVYEQFHAEGAETEVLFDFHKALSNEEAFIISDEYKLTQILLNLVANSVKFTSKGFINFGYEIVSGFIEFYVKDSGIGIPPEFQDDIFKRFRQADNSHTRRYSGSGLGLAISKAYVEMLAGKIWLKSESGKGSEFYFSIPYKKSQLEC